MKRACALMCLACSPAVAQTVIDWSNSAGGAWTEPGNWNPMNVPDNTGEWARFVLPGTYSVLLSASQNIGSLLMTNAGTTVDVQSGVALGVYGPLCTVNGRLRVLYAAGGTPSALVLASGTTLGGTGEVVLDAGDGVPDHAILYAGSGNFIHEAGHTIRGRGNVYYHITNRGVIRADVSGNVLQLLNGTVANAGVIESVSGATMQCNNESIVQTGAGEVRVSGGAALNLVNAAISGGTVTATGGGRIVALSGSSAFSALTLSGPVDIRDGVTLNSSSGLTHTGTLTVNSDGGTAATKLTMADGTTLAGTGEVVLNATEGALDRAHVYAPSGRFTLGAGHTIRGTGNVYYHFINLGMVSADTPAQVLQVLRGAVDNAGTLRATNGGVLLLTQYTVTQGVSGVVAADGGEVRLVDSGVHNGRISAINGGHVVAAAGTQSFVSVLADGPIDITNGSRITSYGVLEHNGTLTINPEGGTASTMLTLPNGATLAGNGEVVLNATEGQLDRAHLYAPTGGFTHAAGHTIRGRGRVYYTATNLGTIDADVNGEVLELLRGAIDNSGRVRASGGGVLVLTQESVVQDDSGTVSADSGGLVLLNSSTIGGGYITASGGGRVVVNSGTSMIYDAPISGPVEMVAGTRLAIPWDLDHSGTLTVNSAATSPVTGVIFGGGGVLTGTGDLQLNADPAAGNSAYIEAAPIVTLVNEHGHTVSGTGWIHASFINHGVVKPSGAGNFISIEQTGFTQAADGTLEIQLGGPGPASCAVLGGPRFKALAGTLSVTLAPGYVPDPCSTFTIVTGPVSGQFDSVVSPTMPYGRLSVQYSPTSVVLSYIPADFNGDGFVTGDDFDAFVVEFELGNPGADFNNDGFVTGDDFDAFVVAFEAGC